MEKSYKTCLTTTHGLYHTISRHWLLMKSEANKHTHTYQHASKQVDSSLSKNQALIS